MASINRSIAIMLSIVFALVGLTMIMSVSENTIPDASEAYYNLANGYNATAIGTGANSIATASVNWLGYLWVVLPFGLGAMLILRAFKGR